MAENDKIISKEEKSTDNKFPKVEHTSAVPGRILCVQYCYHLHDLGTCQLVKWMTPFTTTFCFSLVTRKPVNAAHKC